MPHIFGGGACCSPIVLAHVGRAYYLRNIVGSLEDVAGLPNVFYDLAMLNNWDVLEYLFARVPSERILFGTDMASQWFVPVLDKQFPEVRDKVPQYQRYFDLLETDKETLDESAAKVISRLEELGYI